MTEYQELMLAVCFGSVVGIQIANIGFLIKCGIDAIRKKLRKRKELKIEE